MIPLQRKKRRANKIAAIKLDRNQLTQNLLSQFPQSLFKSALLFGLISLVLFGPLTLLAFKLFGIEIVLPLHYSIFKGLWAGVIAAVMAGPMILVARDSGKNV